MEILRGQIYFAEIPVPKGQSSIQGGYRPVLILQNDKGNIYSPTTICACLTSKMTKKKLPTHVFLSARDGLKNSIVLCEQIMTIDKSILTNYVSTCSDEEMIKISQSIKISLGLK